MLSERKDIPIFLHMGLPIKGHMRRFALVVVMCVLALLLSACADYRELETNLSSKQSREIFVILSRAGITASRERLSSAREELYSVSVPLTDYDEAIELLHEYDLPSKAPQDIETFTRPKGFTPNSKQMSQLRIDYAVGLQIERQLELLPGVVDSRVLVRSGPSQLSRVSAGSPLYGVSVVIRYVSATRASPFSREEVRQIISTALPGIRSDSISIKTSRLILPEYSGILGDSDLAADNQGWNNSHVIVKPFAFRVPEKELGTANKQLLLFSASMILLGIMLGAFFQTFRIKRSDVKRRYRRNRVRNSLLDSGNRTTGRRERELLPSSKGTSIIRGGPRSQK